MLQPMQQPGPSQPSPSVTTFAGLLATLTSPPPPSDSNIAPLWNSSDLGEDVATLSYERAPRTHAPIETDAIGTVDATNAIGEAGAFDARDAIAAVHASPGLQTGTARESDLRSASVTIRMSPAECAQVRQRAGEAGLTVSAYLRSCTVEAEALRAQVKQALAELKEGAEGSSHSNGKKSPAGGDCRDQGSKKAVRQMFFGGIRWLTRRGR
jgi:hypothetical protein